MKDIISFELAKKLDDAGVLKDVDTKYCYTKNGFSPNFYIIEVEKLYGEKYLKAPTLSETIDMLPPYTHIWKNSNNEYCLDNKNIIKEYTNIWGKTQIEAIEKMLGYLLENNLFPKE